MKHLLTPRDVANHLSVSIRSVERLSNQGKLTRIHVGARAVRYNPDEIERFIAAQTAQPRQSSSRKSTP